MGFFKFSERDEGSIQQEIVEKLAGLGYDCLCLELTGGRGWPDLVVFKRSKNGEKTRPLFLEIKDPRGKVSPHQWKVSEFLFSHGQTWYYTDSVAEAIEIVEREFRTQ